MYVHSNTLTLIYTISNVGDKGMGHYMTNLVTSALRHRKIVMGQPAEFHIAKNSSMVFEFIDSYNEDFKLKVFRKEGLPYYKVKSCSNKQSVEDCVSEIEKTHQLADPDNILS
jgi:hypothetical protein